jgi:transposase
MSLRPQPLPLVPEATAAAVHAAFPKGNLYVALRAEFGALYGDQLFADLYPPQGRPVEVAPWRLALVVVMQYIEGLTDRQAADAVRRCMDWKYALSLELTDPGFDFTLLHDFRQRLLTHEAAQRLLDTFLTTCKARGWLKARGTQRTRFDPRPGGDPHPAPLGACPGSYALCAQSAQCGGARVGPAARAAGLVYALQPAVRPGALAEGRQ